MVLRDYEVERILIIDCDVHQGNGNAVLFAQDPRVTTFSMHCEGNFFSQRQISDFDIDLPVACNDERYLGELEIWQHCLRHNTLYTLPFSYIYRYLSELEIWQHCLRHNTLYTLPFSYIYRYLGELEIWLPRIMAASRPQLIFFQAGVDPLANDKMGKCALSVEGLWARNDLVYAAALQAQSKLVVTMGGGMFLFLLHWLRIHDHEHFLCT